jgi:TolB protein
MKKFMHLMLWMSMSGLLMGQGPSSRAENPPQDQPLPIRNTVIDVNAPTRSLYKIGVPTFAGQNDPVASVEVLRNDLRISGLFDVIPTNGTNKVIATVDAVDRAGWTSSNVQGVVQGRLDVSGSNVQMELRLFEFAKGQSASIAKSYRGNISQLRGFVHDFANEVLRALTGEKGVFGTRLTFARKLKPGHKDVFIADFDGYGLSRVSLGRGVSMLPNFGPGGVWYSVLTKQGMYVTRAGMNEKPVIATSGLNMGVAECGGRLLFSSTRDANSEIYSANTDGSDLRRLTNHSGIDVSPTCGPGGQIAFVSSRHGSPQIFVMDGNGGNVRRITFRGSYNQTPSWCQKSETPLVAFTGRDSDMDIFTVNTVTGEYKRLTQGQGTNKDPAFSPDCRMIAYASSRGGVFVMDADGAHQTMVVPGAAETVKWSR